MFSKLQQVFASKATKKPLPTPPVMAKHTTESNTLTNPSTASTSTVVAQPEYYNARFKRLHPTELKKGHDRFKAIDRITGKVCELKVTRITALKPDELIQNCHELAALQAVEDDPNFVTLGGRWEEGIEAYQETEFMPFSLEAARTEQPFDGGRIRLYGAHIVNALEILHSQGITHNDIKLSNIFLSATGRPVLGGMGKAKLLRRILACDDDFYDFNVTDGAEGGHFILGMDYNPDEFSRDIRGLAKSLYKMTTGRRLRRNIYGQPIQQPGDKIPKPLWDLINIIIDPYPSKLKTHIAHVKAHPYFIGIDWDKIASPDAGTFHPAPVIAPKPKDPNATVFTDVPEIECDWQMAYLQAKLKPSAKPAPSPDLQRMTLGTAVRGYTPPGGAAAPRYFSSIEEEELMLGQSGPDEWD